MIIKINTDNNLSVHEAFGAQIEETLQTKLKRFTDHISRLEVHLSDENGSKDGVNDKKCVLEARLEGRQPIAVSAEGNTHELSFAGAIEKLKASLNTVIGKMQNHH